MLTLFTKTPQPRGSINRLRENFGYASGNYDNEEKVLHSTISANDFVKISDTNQKLMINCFNDRIAIVTEDGDEVAFWTRDNLQRTFENKYTGKFIYVEADSRGTGSNEEFNYIAAYEITGFNYNDFINLLEQGRIYIDLRIGQYHSGKKSGKTHDHGTAFRIAEGDYFKLFNYRQIV